MEDFGWSPTLCLRFLTVRYYEKNINNIGEVATAIQSVIH